MKHVPVLSSIDLLLTLDASRSATRAAAELGTTPATLLRRLDAVEAELGTRLFDRSATGLLPTPAMAVVRPWAEQAHAAGMGLMRQISQVEQRPAGTVRVAVPPAVGSLFVVPALGALRAAFPEIVVELAPATAFVDLATRDADIAIRTLRPTSGELIAQRLATARIGVFGAPGLLAPGPQLVDFPWLGWDGSLAAIPEAQWLARFVPEARVVFRASELGTLLSAARAGLGVLAVADAIAFRAGLEPVDVEVPDSPETTLFLVTHEALRPVPRVAAVWSWLLEAFVEGRPEGNVPRSGGAQRT
jgi:DNA-binding transcriptional LysR family regulator